MTLRKYGRVGAEGRIFVAELIGFNQLIELSTPGNRLLSADSGYIHFGASPSSALPLADPIVLHLTGH